MADTLDPLDRIVARLKEPVELSPDLTDRVMAEVERLPLPERPPEAPPASLPWWRRRMTVRVGPLGGLAAAAVLAGVFVAGRLLAPSTMPVESVPVLPVAAGAAADETRLTQFILVAPDAREVSLAGDFNDWNLAATPLTRAEGEGIWWVTVPLEPGRYRYAFVVDGTVWRADPEAPTVVEDEFGRPSSVLTIGGA